MINTIQSFDHEIILLIEKHLNFEILQVFFSALTKLNDYGLLTVFAVLLIIKKHKNPKVSKICIYSIILSLIAVQLLGKNLIQRPRPFQIINHLTIWIEKPETFSFPSGHASISGIGFMLSYLYFNKKLLKYSFMTLFFGITISRLVLKVHFLSDILSGFFIAIIIVIVVRYLTTKQLFNEYQ